MKLKTILTRLQSFIISVITGICGPIADLLYTRDWWSPLTITHTPIGIESVLVGFMIGGIASVVYEDVFAKKVRVPFNKLFEKDETIFNWLLGIISGYFSGSFFWKKLYVERRWGKNLFSIRKNNK